MGYAFNLDDYQWWLANTYSGSFNNAVQTPTERELVLWLGLIGETGELCEKVKKVKRGDLGELSEEEKEIFNRRLLLEFGDIIAYLTLLMSLYDVNLEAAIIANQRKLEARLANSTQHGSGDLR